MEVFCGIWNVKQDEKEHHAWIIAFSPDSLGLLSDSYMQRYHIGVLYSEGSNQSRACQRCAKQNPSIPPPSSFAIYAPTRSFFRPTIKSDASESNSPEVSVRKGLFGVSEEEDQVCGGARS